MIRKLLKALYSLKQAPKLQYGQLSQFLLKKLGFKQINADHSNFVTILEINGSIVSIVVDDIKVMNVKESYHIKKIKLELVATFEITDIGPISFQLELMIKRDWAKKTLKLLQPVYIDKILAKDHLD